MNCEPALLRRLSAARLHPRGAARALATALALAAGSAGAQDAAMPQVAPRTAAADTTVNEAGQAAATSEGPRAVLSGAHPGFDRLVVPLEPGERWHLRRDGDDHLLVVAPADSGAPPPAYTLDAVFTRIGRARLRRIAAEPGGGLRLTLGCDCSLAAFAEAGAWVAIDIADPSGRVAASPPRPRPAAIVRAAPDPALALPLSLPQRSESPPPAARAVASLTASLVVSEAPPDTLADPPLPPTQEAGPATATQVVPKALADTEVPGVRAALDTRVAQAIADGLLSPALRAPTPGWRPPHPATAPADAARHLSTRSALDPEQPPGTSATAPSCPDPTNLDIAAWGGEGAPAAQIAAARGRLLGEFDRPAPGAALALARLYVHHGLGAEARAVLAAFPDPSPAAAATAALAHVVDDPGGTWVTLPPADPGCPGPAALWDIFRAESPATLAPARLQEAVAIFTGLPAHLRSLLGPVAAQRLEATGRSEAGALVRAATLRARPALAAHASGAPGDAVAVEALLGRAEGMLDEGAPLSPSLQETLAAFAFEFGRHPLGGRLAAATIRARAADGDHAAAYSGWVAAQGEGTPDAPLPDGLAGALLESLLATAPPEAVVTVFFRHRDRVLAGIDGGARRRALALRLLEAGLAPEAAAVLAGPPGPDAPELADRLVGARIALARGRAAEARALLGGLDTPEALALRLEAEMTAGAFAEAQQTARALGDPEAIAVADWRAGDRAGAARSAGPSHRAALAAATPTAAPTAPSLRDSRAAITRSQETRAALERLLADPDPRPGDRPPPAPDNAAIPEEVTELKDLSRR